MHIVKILATVYLFSLTHTGFAAGTGGSDMPASPQSQMTPEQLAARYYNSGLKHKKRAWKNEEKAATAKTDKKRDKYLAKVQKSYAKAIDTQKRALQAMGGHYEAANELGYALRKSGDYKNAIGAYNYALQLKPDFAAAKEYKGEALLAMGYFEETKAIYMELFRTDPQHAATLMQALVDWASGLASDAPEEAGTFANWVTERKEIAKVTQVLHVNDGRNW